MQLLALMKMVMGQLQLPVPATIVGNTDPDCAQMLTFLMGAADELVGRYPYTRTMPHGEWLQGSDGLGKDTPDLDTDDVLFERSLILPAMKWRWQSENGFDYAEAFRQVEDKVSRDALVYTRSTKGKVSL